MGSHPTRTAQSARNAAFSVISQLVIILLGFATRSVFISQLGVEMLGVNTLLVSALSMLSLADLGMSGAVMFALYRPLREGDKERVAEVVRYATRLYRVVAVVVAAVGLSATPFLNELVKLESDVSYLEIYYLILLANTVASYLMASRAIIVNADQKIYVTKIVGMISTALRSIVQIVALLVFNSFLIYLIVQVAFTVLNNVAVYLRAGQMYPHIKAKGARLEPSERRELRGSVWALSIFRVGWLILHNSTPILISVIVGTITLGYYSNYILIVSSIVMVTDAVFTAVTPSLGNLFAGADRNAGRRLFDEVMLFSAILHGVVAVAFVLLVDDFIALWIGPRFILPGEVVIAIAAQFYMNSSIMPMWSFRNATGLFRKTQWMMVLTVVASLALSVALGSVVGLPGVVIAPGLAWLLTGGWFEPLLLIRIHLSGTVFRFFRHQLAVLTLWIVVAGVLVFLGSFIPGGVLSSFVIKACFLAVVLPIIVFAVFGRSDAFRKLVRRARSLVSRKGA